jgi:hypothetical protein
MATGVRGTAVSFTHGDRRVVQQDRSISLGKAWLVSRLQMLLQTSRMGSSGGPKRRLHKPISYVLPTPCSGSEKKR